MTDIAELGFRADSSELTTARREMDNLSGSARKVETATAKMERQMATAMKLAGGLTAALSAGLLAERTVANISNFSSEMSGVNSVLNTTDTNMRKLSKTAVALGAETAFSSGEAAAGMRELGQAGFDTTKIIAAMPGTLNLAAAGELSIAEAAAITTKTLAQFNLQANETVRVGDVLAQMASEANTNVRNLGEGLKFVGPVAKSVNMDVEQTTAVLAALSNAGIDAGSAGTGLRRIISELVNPSKLAREELRLAGVTMEDIDLKTHSFVDVLKTLKAKGFDDAGRSAKVFGTEGMSAITALVGMTDKVEELTEKAYTSNGVMQRMAETLRDNLKGDVDELSGAFETLTLKVGEGGALSGMRSFIQGATTGMRAVVNNFDEVIRVANALATVIVGKIVQSLGAYAAGIIAVNYAQAQKLALDAASTAMFQRMTAAQVQETAATVAALGADERAAAVARVKAAADLASAEAAIVSARAEVQAAQGSTAHNAALTRLVMAQEASTAAAIAAIAADQRLLTVDAALTIETNALAAAKARQATATAAAGMAARAASVGMGLLRGVMALLGGPGGVVIAVAAALVYLMSREDEAARKTRELREATDGLADSLQKLDQMSKLTALSDMQQQLTAVGTAIAQAENELDKLMNRGPSSGSEGAVLAWQNAISKAEKNIKTLTDQRREYMQQEQIIAGSLLPKSTDEQEKNNDANKNGTTVVAALTEEEMKRIEQMKAQIAVQLRINQLMDTGVSAVEARYKAEWEAADELGKKLMELQKIEKDRTAASEEQARRIAEQQEYTTGKVKEAADQQAEAYKRTAKKIEDVFRDTFKGILDGSFNLGEALTNWFKGFLVEMAIAAIRNPIIIPMSTAMTGGAGGMLSGLTSMFNPANFMRLGDAFFESGVLPFADMIGNMGMPELAASITDLGASLSGFVGPALGGAVGVAGLYMAGSSLARDDSQISASTQGIGAVLAPGLSLMLSGFDRIAGGNLFGTKWKTSGQTLAINIQDQVADATLTTMRSRKRSMGRGTKRNTIVDDVEDFDNSISEVTGSIYRNVSAALKSVGMELGSFNYDIKLDTKGKTEEEIATMIEEALSGATDALLRTAIPGIDKFVAQGETLSQTFDRLIGGMNVVQGAMDMFGMSTTKTITELGFVFDETGVRVQAVQRVVERSNAEYIRAADALTTLAGGVEKLQAATANFFDKFASDAQKVEFVNSQVSSLFDGLEMKIPATREELYTLVSGLNLFSESGQEAYWTIINSTDLLDNYYATLEAGSAEALAAAERETKTRMSLEQQLMTLQGDTAGLRALELAGLSRANQALQTQIYALNDMAAAAAAAAQHEQNLANLRIRLAQAQGNSAEVSRLRREQELADAETDAERALLNKIYKAEDKAAADAAAEAARKASAANRDYANSTKKVMTATRDLTGEFLSMIGATAEMRARERAALPASQRAQFDALKTLEDQKIATEKAVGAWDTIIDKLKDFSKSVRDEFVTSLEQSRKVFDSIGRRALLGNMEAMGDLPEAAKALADASLAQSSDEVAYLRDIANIQRVITAAQDVAGRQKTIAEQQYEQLAQQTAYLFNIMRSLEDLRGYSSGGMHSGGLRLVGEDGAEIEMTGPSRIVAGMSLSGGGGMETQFAMFRQDMYRWMFSLINNTAKTADNTRATVDSLEDQQEAA